MSEQSDNVATSTAMDVSIAMNEAVRMLDTAPMTGDLFPTYNLAQYAIRASMTHTAIELGLKELSATSKKYGHDLGNIYCDLKSDIKELLSKAWQDAVSFYNFQTDRPNWQHLRDFQTYLNETGTSDYFDAYRYWPREEPSAKRLAKLGCDLLLSREMMRFISACVIESYYAVRQERQFAPPPTLSQEINRVIDQRIRFRFSLIGIAPCDLQGWETDARALFEWLQNQGSPIKAMESAYQNGFQIVNERADKILRGAYEDLKTEDNYRVKDALQYALTRIEVQAYRIECPTLNPVPSIDEFESDGPRRIRVNTPSGTTLGLAKERFDGFWIAHYGSKAEFRVVADECAAISLIVAARTKIARVSVPGKLEEQEIRVTDPPSVPFLFQPTADFEFWDDKHGIAQGDEITIALPADDENQRIENKTIGAVEAVNGHIVTISGITIADIRHT